MIEGVKIKKLKKIPDERGTVLHMLRNDDKEFDKFGEIYFSFIYQGVIKGWHMHIKKTLNYAVIEGMAKIVLYDDRKESSTRGQLMEIFVGDANYCLITVPPRVWNGVKAIGDSKVILANCSTLPYHPKDIIKMDPFKNNLIKYDWNIKHE